MNNKDMPAFPVTEEMTDRIDTGVKISSGLSKREWFIGMALQGLCANARYFEMPNATITQYAIGEADRILTELSKTENELP